jgi:hypothetical protein
MKALFWVIATPLVIIAASFAASNRNTVEVGVWPLSFIRGLSVYANALGALGGAVSGLGTTERAGANGRACSKQMQPKLSTVIAL